MGGALRGLVAIESEPKDHSSPLYGITKWGASFVKTYARGIAGSLGLATTAARALGGALVPSLVSSIATPRASPGVGGGITINLTVQGDLRADERTLPGTILRTLNAAGIS
jgi:hypothetical protein